MWEHLWVACEGHICMCIYIYICVCVFSFDGRASFGFHNFFFLFSVCTGCYPLDGGVQVYSLCMLSRRWGQWAGPIASVLLPRPWQWEGPVGRWGAQATPGFRALGSGSDPQGGGQQQQWGVCMRRGSGQWLVLSCRAFLSGDP